MSFIILTFYSIHRYMKMTVRFQSHKAILFAQAEYSFWFPFIQYLTLGRQVNHDDAQLTGFSRAIK